MKTPGREGSENKLFRKADYLNKNTGVANPAVQVAGIDTSKMNANQKLACEVIEAYGGKANITNVDACITKLRVEVKSANKVDSERLKNLGAKGVLKISDTAVYSVFGTKADILKNQINEILPKM
ncbi:MAG: PTS glucose/sucrose transporter subunit IIB [Mycoplasmoidaceae bacterium]|nr:PTS glucose/sucrose transporter subunit IIB [Mycoplasmoidaceae bacterium]